MVYEEIGRTESEATKAEPTVPEVPWREFEAERRTLDTRRKRVESARQQTFRAAAELPAEPPATAVSRNVLSQRWRVALSPPEAVAEAAVEVAAGIVSAPRRVLDRWRQFWRR